MQTKKQKTGTWGEDQAAHFLSENGYKIVERNFRVRKGEIDIIAWHKKKGENTLCFVEVKTREGESGSAERATGREKLQHIFHTAKEYCLLKNIQTEKTAIQFEHVSVYILPGETKILHYEIPVL